MSIRRILPIGTHLRQCILCGYPIAAMSDEPTAHELACIEEVVHQFIDAHREEKKDDDQRTT